MRNFLPLCFVFLLFSCEDQAYQLRPGLWKASLEVQDSEQLPFIFEVLNDGTLLVQNADERILVDEIVIKGDSIRIQMPVYEGYFSGRFGQNKTTITGDFIKPSLDRVVPFVMTYGADQPRFATKATRVNNIEVNGTWETVFSPNNEDDRYVAMGIFEQNGTQVTGTFRTTTGDYRYLEGVKNGDELRLSTFDGAHAFLFVATVKGDSLHGVFYSGNHWQEPFRAKRNKNYKLPDTNTLTYLKEGYEGVAFSFPDESGKLVSLADGRFKDKVVLVQILGSWCPNCIEETAFYMEYLKNNPTIDLEIIGLAFEYAPTEEKAFASIKRLKDRLGVSYPILLAQYGTEDKKLANKKLPMLNHVLSYPTTIFIDKKGGVRRIHTGFNGKATGSKYTDYKKEFETFVMDLVKED